MDRFRPVVTAAILATFVLLSAACSGGSGDAQSDAATTTTVAGADGTSTTEPEPPCTIDTCTLQEAGARQDLEVGVAVKLGDPARLDLQAQEFDAASSEIEFLWSVIHPAPDVWDFTGADEVVAFAETNDKDLMATHAVWDPPAIRDVLPDWVRAIEDPDELRAVVRNYLTTIQDRYGDAIDRLVVINEPLDFDGLEEENHYFQVLGPGYVAEFFEMADEVFGDTTDLVLNQDSTEYIGGKADGLVSLTRDLLDADVRVDRVGLQGHLTLGEPDWELIERTISELAELGVTVDLTEVDVPRYNEMPDSMPVGPQVQADRAGRMVRLCLDEPRCASVTFWGLDDGDTWLTRFIGPDTQPLLFDDELQPKAMYDAVLRELVAGR